jgi:GDP-L-fucose synthase
MEMYKSNKIFVAGHKGLVGSAIVNKLRSEGFNNLVLRDKESLDLRDQLEVKEFFKEEKPEFVFLAAAKVGGINWNYTHPADFIYDNLLIQSNVIDSAYRNGAKKLLFLGSACIYPKVTPQPIKEEYLLTAPLEPTNEGYALAKITGLRMCEYYRRQYGFNAISCMPANLYGPNDNFIPEHGHVIPGIITKLRTAIINNDDTIECWGDGTPTREFLYVDDLADACVFLMQTYNEAQFINVGSNEELTIKDLAENLKSAMGFTGEIVWNTDKPNGTPRRKMDNSKLAALGWNAKVDFNEGLKRTIEWYKKERGML